MTPDLKISLSLSAIILFVISLVITNVTTGDVLFEWMSKMICLILGLAIMIWVYVVLSVGILWVIS